MDLIDVQKFSEHNDGYKYIMTIIDCFSRYAMAIPMKSKRTAEVIARLSKAFKEYSIPQKVFGF